MWGKLRVDPRIFTETRVGAVRDECDHGHLNPENGRWFLEKGPLYFLYSEVRKILSSPDRAKRFVELGGEPRATSPEEMRGFIEREIARWRGVIASRKIERL
jgi:hypothetical protein